MASLRRKPIQRFTLFASAVVLAVYAIDRDYAPHPFRAPCAPVDECMEGELPPRYERKAPPLVGAALNESIRDQINYVVSGWPVDRDRDEAHFNLQTAKEAMYDIASPRAGLPYRIGYEPFLDERPWFF